MSDYADRIMFYAKRLREYEGNLMEDDIQKIISYLGEGQDYEEGTEVSTEY